MMDTASRSGGIPEDLLRLADSQRQGGSRARVISIAAAGESLRTDSRIDAAEAVLVAQMLSAAFDGVPDAAELFADLDREIEVGGGHNPTPSVPDEGGSGRTIGGTGAATPGSAHSDIGTVQGPGDASVGAGRQAPVIGTVLELDDVWARYKDDPNQADRDQLIVYYAPLVKFVASRIAEGLPQDVDEADLVSHGMFGLIDAITKFDPSLGYKFETYAISRIKGAVLDELRSIDWVPRSVRAKAKSVEQAMTKLESTLHRPPTDAEIAEELNLSLSELNSLYDQISSLGIVALDETLSFNGGDNITLAETLTDGREGPGKTFSQVEMRQILAEAINRMDDREKIVLTLFYFENLTLAEIGQVLGVTESRVCQIHTKAILGLRSWLNVASHAAEPVARESSS